VNKERDGLLSRTDIGTKEGWLSLLADNKLTMSGHQISKIDNAGDIRQ
jgi:hypothetical protein